MEVNRRPCLAQAVSASLSSHTEYYSKIACSFPSLAIKTSKRLRSLLFGPIRGSISPLISLFCISIAGLVCGSLSRPRFNKAAACFSQCLTRFNKAFRSLAISETEGRPPEGSRKASISLHIDLIFLPVCSISLPRAAISSTLSHHKSVSNGLGYPCRVQ